MSDSDSWDDYPWIPVTYRPRSPPPKRWRDPNKPRKKKDLNEGKVTTVHRIRIADDGTKWHSQVDILRPDSPPVEWPEYPNKPTEDDFPKGFRWDEVSDLDEENPLNDLRKLGIPMKNVKIRKRTKKWDKLERKIKRLEEKMAQIEAEEAAKTGPPPCNDPELKDDDNLWDLRNDDDFKSVNLYPTTGYGGGVTNPLDDDDFYPHDRDVPREGPRGLGGVKPGVGRGKEVQYNFDSGETGSDTNYDPVKAWEEFKNL